MSFSLIAVTSDTSISILGVQNLSFGRPGASVSPPWGPLCQLGDTLVEPWQQQEDNVGVRNQMTESTLSSDWSGSGKAAAF